jgi:histidine triad (HIT) family protein
MAYDNDNIFAKILRGEIPCVKVYEDDKTLAFMDVMPQARGHTLVIPREAAEDILDLSPGGLAAMMATTQKVALAIHKALEPDGIVLTQFNGAAAGQSVFHVHFHIIPRKAGDVLAPHARGMVDAKTLEPIAAKIRSALQG